MQQQLLFVLVVWLVCGGRTENVTETGSYTEETSTTTIFDEVSTTEQTFSSMLPPCELQNGSCEVNGTSGVPTVQPDTHTHNTNVEKYKRSFGKGCFCDLQRRFCDINCCCDTDCSYDDKMVFKTCDDHEDFVPDTKFCKYVQYMYRNRTLYEWEVTQNSLFCIVKSNLPPRYLAQKKQNVITKTEAQLRKRGAHPWPPNEINEIHEPKIDFHRNITYGDPVWFVRNNREIFALEFPNSFATDTCLLKAQVKFLKDQKTECFLTGVNADYVILKAETYYKNLTVVSVPRSLLPYADKLHECPRNVCLPIVAKICDENFNTCINVTEKTKNREPSCSVDLKNGNYVCENLVVHVRHYIYHNGTFGIRSVETFLILRNISFDVNDDHRLRQIFEVKFLWHNYTTNHSDYLSGHPGYIFGKPVLIADLVVNVTNNGSAPLLERDHRFFAKNFMVFPANVRGVCVLTNDTSQPVEFGYNAITKCVIRERLKMPVKNVCRTIQNVVFKYWSLEVVERHNITVNRTVGKFGNANSNVSDDWTSVVFYTETPQEILNATTAFNKSASPNRHVNKSASIVCHNVTTTMTVDLFHAREQHDGTHNQEKIVGAFVDFANFKNFEFLVANNEIFVEIPIRTEACFYDITAEQQIKFADPPSLNFKLPFDFFYPFIRVGNAATKIYYNTLWITLTCFIALS